HAGELPGGAQLAVLGGITVGLDGLLLVPALVGREAELEDGPGAGALGRTGLVVEHLVVERKRAARAADHGQRNDSGKGGKPNQPSYPHRGVFPAPPPDGSPRRRGPARLFAHISISRRTDSRSCAASTSFPSPPVPPPTTRRRAFPRPHRW